jgi:hypothetical protein
MKCRYCNIALAPLRSLTDGEFCCDEHRVAFAERGEAEAIAPLPLESSLIPLQAKFESVSAAIPEAHPSQSAPLEFRPKTMAAPAFSAPVEAGDTNTWFSLAGGLLALKFRGQLFNTADPRVAKPAAGDPKFPAAPVLPGAYVEPPMVAAFRAASEVASETGDPMLDDTLEEHEAHSARLDHVAREAARSWRWMVDVWKKAPSELKIMTVLLPILLAVAVSPSTPNVQISSNAGKQVQKLVADRWTVLNKSIVNRAAVAYTDDFRSGLDGWESRSNLTTRWAYDASGFVEPGPLAVFRPTVDLTDYRFEFLGEIDKKGMGCAFRATNLDNYYAVKLVVVRPGPLPEVHVVRYAVIGGKEGPRVEKPLPFVVRADMLYRIRVDVRGSDFAIRAQDQIIDFWTDDRLQHGGVGLFCARGEKARVRWLEVSHQYDTLGRLCAYLAPYGIEGRNGIN